MRLFLFSLSCLSKFSKFSVVRIVLKIITKKMFDILQKRRVSFERLWYLVINSPSICKLETG